MMPASSQLTFKNLKVLQKEYSFLNEDVSNALWFLVILINFIEMLC